MSVELASAYVSLVPSARGMGTAISKELGGPLADAGGKAGDRASSSFRSKFGSAIKLAGPVLFAGLALGAVKLGESFDQAYDSIQTGTGETGKALEGLKDDFRAVVRDVPTDFGSASKAVTDLHQRLGLSGGTLQNIAGRMLNLSRITETDLGGNIQSITRLFGDWGITADDMAERMDQVFRASQATGAPVDQLAASMTKFGGPMRQLGFDFATTAGLLGKFEKEGVNTDLVMGSMRIALGKMAREGEPAQETLQRVTEDIANAGSASEANAMALELFGARAGPDMAAAIREGRFELGDLLETIQSGDSTINDTAKSTQDFGEKWTLIKNRVLLALEPLVAKVFDALGVAMDRLPGIATRVWNTLRTGIDFLRENKPILLGVATAIGVGLVAAFYSWATAAGAAAIATLTAIAPVLLVAAGIGALVAGLVYAYENWEGFRKVVDTVVAWLKKNVPPAFEAIKRAIAAAFEWVNANVVPVVKKIAQVIAETFARLVGWVRDHWEQIKAVIAQVVAVIRGVIEQFVGTVQALWRRFGDNLLSIIRTTWDYIRNAIKAAIEIVRGIIKTVTSLIKGDWSGVWEGIKQVVKGVWDGIVNIVRTGIRAVREGISTALDVMKGIWSTAWSTMSGVVQSVWGGITGVVAGVLNAIVGALESSINLAIRAINSGINALDAALGPFLNFGELSEVSFGRIGVSTGVASTGVSGGGGASGIPVYHGGGIHPGAATSQSLALLRGREMVLTTSQQAALFNAASGGQSRRGMHVENLHINTREDVDEFYRRAEFYERAGAL